MSGSMLLMDFRLYEKQKMYFIIKPPLKTETEYPVISQIEYKKGRIGKHVY